ncbi:MAG: hypothetical protein Pg6A_05420 [Termitinemataceae bacterium]|nr:MAG: hypothetical protein Pg6A_05420 [Termitinemataceae bacterium]
MPKLLISPEAKKDVREIQTYIAEILESPKAAFNMVSGIIDKIESLLQFPEKGRLLNTKLPLPARYRVLMFKHYGIFYRYEAETIFVDRVIYAKRDYVTILFPELADENR